MKGAICSFQPPLTFLSVICLTLISGTLLSEAKPHSPYDWRLVLKTGDPETLRPFRIAYSNNEPIARLGSLKPDFDVYCDLGEILVGDAPCGGRAILLRCEPTTQRFIFVFAPRVDNGRRLQFGAGANDRFLVEFEYFAPASLDATFNVHALEHPTPLKIESAQGTTFVGLASDSEISTTLVLPSSAEWTEFRCEVSGIQENCNIFFGIGLSTATSNTVAGLRLISVHQATE